MGGKPKFLVLSRIRNYVYDLLEIFGLDYKEQTNNEDVKPVIDTICQFREKVRSAAREKKFQEILGFCDEIRDKSLPKIGIIIEDTPEGTRWKKGSPEDIAKEIERKAREEQVHPLVRTHPDTGRKLLYIGTHVSHVVGMERAESAALRTRRFLFAVTSGADGVTAAPSSTARRSRSSVLVS